MLSGDIPDTGNLRGDVLAVLRRISARLAELRPETFYGLLGDYFADPALVPDLQAQVLHTGNEVMATILKRAAERGEALDDIPPRVATLPIDLLRHELFRDLSPADEHAITEIVDQVFLPSSACVYKTAEPRVTDPLAEGVTPSRPCGQKNHQENGEQGPWRGPVVGVDGSGQGGRG